MMDHKEDGVVMEDKLIGNEYQDENDDSESKNEDEQGTYYLDDNGKKSLMNGHGYNAVKKIGYEIDIDETNMNETEGETTYDRPPLDEEFIPDPTMVEPSAPSEETLYNGSLNATPIELQKDLFLQQGKLPGPTLIYKNENDNNIYGLPIKNISIFTEFHIQTAFTRMEITFVYNNDGNNKSNKKSHKTSKDDNNGEPNNGEKSRLTHESVSIKKQGNIIETGNANSIDLNDISRMDALFALPLTTNGTMTHIEAIITNPFDPNKTRYIETTLIDTADLTEIAQMIETNETNEDGPALDNDMKTDDNNKNTENSNDSDNKSDNGITATQFNSRVSGGFKDGIFNVSLEDYIPDLFRLPICNLVNNDEICIKAEWMQTLDYENGRYHFTIPLTFMPNILACEHNSDIKLKDIINIKCVINGIVPGLHYGSNSHHLSLIEYQNNGLKTKLQAFPQNNVFISKDFHLAYYTKTNMITGVLLHEPAMPGCEYDKDGSFVTFLNPPANSATKQFGRDIIFLVDRSGSMTGSPFQNACNGLSICLEMLKNGNNDRFGIVCFNHKQRYFNPNKFKIVGNGSMLEDIETGACTHGSNKREEMGFDGGIGDTIAPKHFNLSLYEANATNIEKGKLFVKDNYATGGTDIQEPLSWAVNMLEEKSNANENDKNNENNENQRMSFVVLLTDGAVYNERDIVLKCEKQIKNVRVLTFGIGKWCNWYFLKLLAIRSRGWQDGAMYSQDLERRIKSMMQRAHAPILRDLSINGLNGTFVKSINDSNNDNNDKNDCQIEMYPSEMSDLFIGASVINAARYHVNNEQSKYKFPNFATINGKNVYDKNIEYRINTDVTSEIPVNRVFVKQRIDQLTAQQWLSKNDEMKKEIIETSIKESFPSMYTSMVAVELTPKEKQELERERIEKMAKDKTELKEERGVSDAHRGLSKKQILGIGAAGALGLVVLGTGAMAFGDANVGDDIGGLFENMGDIIDNIGDADLNCCESCGCDDCGCDAICEPIGDCCDSIGESFQDCFQAIGEAFGQCFEAIGNLCENIGQCIGGACDNCGDCMNNIDCDCDGCDADCGDCDIDF